MSCFVLFDVYVLLCIYVKEGKVRETCPEFGVNDREVCESLQTK